MLERITYDKIRFEKKNLIYDIGLLKMIEINDVEEIKRVLKSKRSSFMINFDNDLKIDCFEIKMKSTQRCKVKSLLLLLSLLLSLSLFKKCLKIYKILKI